MTEPPSGIMPIARELGERGHRLAMLRAVADLELEQWDAQQRARQEVIWADEGED